MNQNNLLHKIDNIDQVQSFDLDMGTITTFVNSIDYNAKYSFVKEKNTITTYVKVNPDVYVVTQTIENNKLIETWIDKSSTNSIREIFKQRNFW